MKSEEIIHQKVYVSLRPPPKISYKDNWTCDLDSDVARSSNEIQRIELKPNTQLSSTRRLVARWRKETLERTKFDCDTLNQEKHDNVTDPTRTEKPVCGYESTKRCVLTPKLNQEKHDNVTDPTRTGKPVCGYESWCSTSQNRGSKRVPHGLECVEEMLQENWLSRWTFHRYSRSISQRSSLSWITTRNRMVRTKSAKSGMKLRKKTILTNPLKRKGEDTKGQRYLILNKAGKNGLVKLRSDYRAAVMKKNFLKPRIRRTNSRAHPSKSRKTHKTWTRSFLRRLLVQRSSWPTYRMAILAFIFKFVVVVRIRMELEVTSQCFFCSNLSLLWQLVSFTIDSDPLQPTMCVNRTPSHRIFSHALNTCVYTTLWLKVPRDVSS